jgi:hypothetical protein
MCAVTPADGVIVTCAPPDGTWPTGSFTVDVTATGGPEGCKGTGSGSAKVTVDAKPTVSVQVDDADVCDADSTKILTVIIGSSEAMPYNTVTVSSPGDICTPKVSTNGENQASKNATYGLLRSTCVQGAGPWCHAGYQHVTSCAAQAQCSQASCCFVWSEP